MERWRERIAVVTGASSGIGATIARDLLAAGIVVVGLARRVARMAAMRATLPEDQQARWHVRECDVTDLQSVNAAFDWIEQSFGGVDILVNNAGKLLVGQLLTMEVATLQDIVQTNIMGVVHCTQRAYRSLKARNADGHVFVINSIVGHYLFNPLPGTMQELNMYPATKHALTAITETLRQEFRGFGTKIKVTSISPGLVDTDLVPQAYKALPMLAAEDVSGAIIYALGTPPHVQVHDLMLKPMSEPF